jgi:hypothetical protein
MGTVGSLLLYPLQYLHTNTQQRGGDLKYALVIKASTKDEAIEAALDHGVDLLIVDKHPNRKEVIATAQIRSVVRLQRWLMEDVRYDPPYPVGSLLHFSKVTKRGYRNQVNGT